MSIDIAEKAERERGGKRTICGITNEMCRYTGQRGGNWCTGCEIAEEVENE